MSKRGHANSFKFTLYTCFIGYIVQAITVNLVPLFFVIFQRDFGVSFEQIGRLVLLNFTTQIVTDLLSVRWADRMGTRRCLVLAHFCSAAGLIGLSIFPRVMPPYLGLAAATIIYAVGGGLIEVLISPIVESLPSDGSLSSNAKSAAMSLLHSFYCWGQLGVILITTLLLRLTGEGLWWIFPLLWAVVPTVNLFFCRKCPLPEIGGGEKSVGLSSLLHNRIFWLALVLMASAGASELAMSQWSSLFAEKALGVPKVMGDLLGPCLFALLMGSGRLFYAKMGDKISLEPLLLSSAGLCILCYCLTVFVPLPAFSLMGCAVCGLSVSLMWPGTLSMTAKRFPGGNTAMFGILALFGDVGASLGPWMAGVVSDNVTALNGAAAWGTVHGGLLPEQLGLKAGLLTAMIFPVIMFVGVWFMMRAAKKKRIP